MGTKQTEDASSLVLPNKTFVSKLSWLQIVRPLTFSGTISPILAGTGLASLHGEVRLDLLIVLIAAALCVQISANLFNDYFDFKHGQDRDRWKTIENERDYRKPAHHQLPYAAATAIILSVILGFWISLETSWTVALIGSAGIISGFLYSAGKHSFSSLGLGEVVASIFLGFVTTILGYITQGQTINSFILAVAAVYALLIATMILTNNIRDIKKDAGFRKTLAMRLGKQKAKLLLSVILTAIYALVLFEVFLQILPITSLISFLAIPAALKLRGCFRQEASNAENMQSMGWAAKHHWSFGLLLAISIWTG